VGWIDERSLAFLLGDWQVYAKGTTSPTKINPRIIEDIIGRLAEPQVTVKEPDVDPLEEKLNEQGKVLQTLGEELEVERKQRENLMMEIEKCRPDELRKHAEDLEKEQANRRMQLQAEKMEWQRKIELIQGIEAMMHQEAVSFTRNIAGKIDVGVDDIENPAATTDTLKRFLEDVGTRITFLNESITRANLFIESSNINRL
jgi:ribosomal protein L29